MTLQELGYRDPEYYEEQLGPARDFILTVDKLTTLRKWAVSIGISAVEVFAMPNVSLVNLYHERAALDKEHRAPSQHHLDAAEMVLRIVQTIEDIPTLEALRSVIREEIPTVEMLRREAQAVYDALPPRKIEVTTERGSIVLGGRVHYLTEKVLRVVGMGHPVMMIGPAGCGKTTIGEHCAKALQLPFFITSTVMDTHELMGFVDGYGNYKQTPFRQAFEFGGVWVADEIDAWDAAVLLTANSALANGFATFPDSATPVQRHPNFRMIATANTFGNGADRVYVGRNELDAASLDRFAFIAVDYDSSLEELLCAGNPRWLRRVWEVRKKVEEKKIRHVVSTRAIIFGSQALQIGMLQHDVEEIYLFKGMSKTDKEKIS